MTRISMLATALAVGLLASSAAAIRADSTKEEVTSSVSGLTTTWHITRPVISQPEKSYTKIKFEEGDVVTIEAGGCDQTGGLGKTWKRYVDPQGDNTDKLYHGLIEIPGVTNKFKASPTGKKGLVRLLDMDMKNPSTGEFHGTFVVGDLSKVAEKDRYLRLGFEDDGYSDNGYANRNSDDGTGDQCKGLGDAYVTISVRKHKTPGSSAGKKEKEAEKPAPTK